MGQLWINPPFFIFPDRLWLKRLRIFFFWNNQLGTCAPSFTQRPWQQFILSCSLMDSKRLRAGGLGGLNWHDIFVNLQVLRNEQANELSFLRIWALLLIKRERERERSRFVKKEEENWKQDTLQWWINLNWIETVKKVLPSWLSYD